MESTSELLAALFGGGTISALLTYFVTRQKLALSTEALYMKQFDAQVARYLEEIKSKDAKIEQLYNRVDEANDKAEKTKNECDRKIRELEERMRAEWRREITANGKKPIGKGDD